MYSSKRIPEAAKAPEAPEAAEAAEAAETAEAAEATAIEAADDGVPGRNLLDVYKRARLAAVEKAIEKDRYLIDYYDPLLPTAARRVQMFRERDMRARAEMNPAPEKWYPTIDMTKDARRLRRTAAAAAAARPSRARARAAAEQKELEVKNILPENWVVNKDNTERGLGEDAYYFYNTKTKETKWIPKTIDDIMKTIDDKINEDVPAAKTAISRKDDKLAARRFFNATTATARAETDKKKRRDLEKAGIRPEPQKVLGGGRRRKRKTRKKKKGTYKKSCGRRFRRRSRKKYTFHRTKRTRRMY